VASSEIVETCWAQIAEKLEREGFSIERECIAQGQSSGLWCVRVSRDGRQWTTYAGDPAAALTVVESQTREVVERCRDSTTPDRGKLGSRA